MAEHPLLEPRAPRRPPTAGGEVTSLDGRSIARFGMLDNSRGSADVLLSIVRSRLQSAGGPTFGVQRKETSTRPATPDIIDELATYEAAIVGVSD